jgi:PAS domain-containing protein
VTNEVHVGSGAGAVGRRDLKRSADLFAISTVVVIFLSIAVPWFVQAVDTDIIPAAWSAFLLTAAYLSAALIIDRWGNAKAVNVGLYLAPFLAVVMAAVEWHFAGGIGRPALLTAFALPILAATFVPHRSVPYGVAAVAAAAATVTSMIEAPSLGWYISQSGIALEWLIRWIPAPPPTAKMLDVAPADQFASLQAFTIAMFALAAVSTRIVAFVARESIVRIAAESPNRMFPLLGDALRSSPVPLVVVTRTAQIVMMSDSFQRQMLTQNRAALGRELFEFATFHDREQLVGLLAGGGHLDFVRYRVGQEERIATADAERFTHRDEEYFTLTIRDWNELGYLALAADAVDRPLLLIGTDDHRLRYANRAASNALGELYVGRDMSWLPEGTRMALRLLDAEPATLVALAAGEHA